MEGVSQTYAASGRTYGRLKKKKGDKKKRNKNKRRRPVRKLVNEEVELAVDHHSEEEVVVEAEDPVGQVCPTVFSFFLSLTLFLQLNLR